MAMQFIPLYTQHVKAMSRLSDQQVGRVVRSLCQYALTGVAPQLDIVQGVMFDILSARYDHDAQTYQTKCEKLSKNSRKRWKQENANANAQQCMQMDAIAQQSMQLNANAQQGMQLQVTKLNQTKLNQTKLNQTNTLLSQCKQAAVSEADGFVLADEEVQAITHERSQVFAKAKDAGFEMTPGEVEQINALCADYGDDAVKDGLRQCVRNGAHKITYLTAVLKNKASGKGKPQTAKGGKPPLRQQNYEQRQYEQSTGLPDYMKTMLAQMQS